MLHYLMTALSVACLSLAVAAAGLHEPSADYTVRFSAEARWTEPGLKGQPTRTNNSPGNLRLQKKSKRLRRLSAFQWQNCGAPDKEWMVVESLSILPDPIFIPGTITINATVAVNKTVHSPLQVDVLLEKETFGTWLKVPCIHKIGSCSYPDLCAILSSVTCPSSFVQQKVPCHCPFPKGSYKLTNAGVDIEVYADVPVGDYRFTANLTSSDHFIACYNITASITN